MLPTNTVRSEWITAVTSDATLSEDARETAQSVVSSAWGLTPRSYTNHRSIRRDLPHLSTTEILDALDELKTASYVITTPYGALYITVPEAA